MVSPDSFAGAGSTDAAAIVSTSLREHCQPFAIGKVREVYAIQDGHLLFVATDRISAYDVIMKNGIPRKGILLTQLSAHWFRVLQAAIPSLRTHFVTLDLPPLDVPGNSSQPPLPQKLLDKLRGQLEGRSMQVRRTKVFPIEAIVRGYITGSAWNEYQTKGTVHGIQVEGPEGRKLRESEAFERPLYTPSTKAKAGEKDENIHPDQAAQIVGEKYAKRIEELSLALYTTARAYAAARGIIIADTKFEFGLDEVTDDVVLIDEVLTPDSSRFWPADTYEVGRTQQSFDKQYLRDWLTSNKLKGKEGVEIPAEVLRQTSEKYVEAYNKLVGDAQKP